MKRILRLLLLTSLLTAALCVSVLAAEPTEAGIYGVTGSGVTLTPQKADGTEVSSTTLEGYGNYYTGAVRFKVEATGLTSGEQYLLLVLSGTGAPTDKNIAYIDQQAASDGKVSFNAYPSSLTKETYRVYIVGSGKAFDAENPAASFGYYQPYKLGDANGDNVVNVNDAVKILKCIVGNDSFLGSQELAADANRDNVVNVNDAVTILKYIVGNGFLGK